MRPPTINYYNYFIYNFKKNIRSDPLPGAEEQVAAEKEKPDNKAGIKKAQAHLAATRAVFDRNYPALPEGDNGDAAMGDDPLGPGSADIVSSPYFFFYFYFYKKR